MLDILYALAGAGAILLIFGTVIRDTAALVRWVRHDLDHAGTGHVGRQPASHVWTSHELPPATLATSRQVLLMAVLVALWLVLAWAR